MKRVLIPALFVLLTTSVVAQTTAPTTPANPAAPSANQSPAATAPATTTSSSNRFTTSQSQEQWLVGNLMNKRVYNAAGQSIGDLNDVLIDRNGNVIAVIIGVGGFLGIGEKNVAVDYNFLKSNGGITGDRIVVGMNEQDLRAAPDFERIKPAASNQNNAPRTQ